MSLTSPNLVYTILTDAITGRKTNPTNAAMFLDEFFKKKDKMSVLYGKGNFMGKKKSNSGRSMQSIADKMRVVLIDELDALITKK